MISHKGTFIGIDPFLFNYSIFIIPRIGKSTAGIFSTQLHEIYYAGIGVNQQMLSDFNDNDKMSLLQTITGLQIEDIEDDEWKHSREALEERIGFIKQKIKKLEVKTMLVAPYSQKERAGP